MRVALFRLLQEAVGKCEKTAGPRGELRHAIWLAETALADLRDRRIPLTGQARSNGSATSR